MSYSKRQPTKTLITSAVLVMVVLVIAVLYFFSVSPSYFDPLYLKLRSRCETCEKAKAFATKDFNNGIYQVVAWGLISSESPTLKVAEILARDYKIKMIFGGCIRQENIVCYDTYMRKLLGSKLGNTFYENAYEQVKKQTITPLKQTFVKKKIQ